MQPMGHLQLLLNLLEHRLDPQRALDCPRWYLKHAGEKQSSESLRHSEVLLEQGYGGRDDGGG
jgi:gamma-glutamyltranspeptidase